MLVNGSPSWQGTPIDPPGGGGNNGGMEARIATLEAFAKEAGERLVRIEVLIENFERTFASKADLHKEIGAQTWRIIGAMITFGGLLCAATFFIAKNIH